MGTLTAVARRKIGDEKVLVTNTARCQPWDVVMTM